MEFLQTQLVQLQHQNEALQQQLRQMQEQQHHQNEQPALPLEVNRESTKYSYVISHLDERYANEVEDLITTPPADNPYTTLKTEIIRRLSVSEERRVRQLLVEEELCDRTPSQFLRHLRSLVGSTTGQDNLLRTIWMQRLPAHVQAMLQPQIGQTGLTTDTLAVTADKIIEIQPGTTFNTASNSAEVHAASITPGT
ncbi:uncharacterized protein LOC116176103 [Photinus pyralis]|uniref:uncharacterized protein LOC116176103 n=1 Tax=Photinus pyralis TaxID=7054 RepID=UPI00126709F8|nr:uncharacterized protein LOC116176103 [Photinus pyralis]